MRRTALPLGRLQQSSQQAAGFVVFLLLPCGNATFLLVIITLFGWLAVVGVRLAVYHSG